MASPGRRLLTKKTRSAAPEIVRREVQWVSGALPLLTRDARFVMLNDVHVPHNIDLTAVFAFIADYRPDYVLLVGDIMNMDPFDHWARMSAKRAKEMPTPGDYYRAANASFYRPLRSAAGKGAKIVHWIGNHEYWAYRAIQAMPEGEGAWEPEFCVDGVDWWVEPLQIASLGRLHFMHGDVLKGGMHHASSVLHKYYKNVRYGHFHDIQEASHTSPFDETDRHTARCCGTLQKYGPDYMGKRPHNWQHAFTWGVVAPSGIFWDQTTKVVNGRFYAEKKMYGLDRKPKKVFGKGK
jgi:hypothetical protein